MKIFGLSVVLMLAVGCSNLSTKGASRWTPELLAGLTMTRDDRDVYERLEFSRNEALVAVTRRENGAVVFPGLQWRLEDEWLVLFDGRGQKWEELKLSSIGNSFITATMRNGRTVRFEYKTRKQTPPQPLQPTALPGRG